MSDQPVSLSSLRAALDLLLRRIEAANGGDAVELDVGYFWSIPFDAIYDVADPPATGDLTLGDLSESWDHIRNLLENPDDAIPYHLVWLADILRALGHRHI
ncbi:hypothetical protein EDD29_6173 [Actinocorallia herbida]|uniref:Uncharacterized protein n=1 Tax=Actinocorallia herbida TaxID=58109 RepID=A0A3N1D4P2_9ACTN|nr:hypothetical protein [Actinocorallia herbida]ROO88504.1 hypothetical protein EDD29_6173 [Actinocorallia herbida]